MIERLIHNISGLISLLLEMIGLSRKYQGRIRTLICAVVVLLSFGSVWAQQDYSEEEIEKMLRPYSKPKVFKGYYHTVIDGDSVVMYVFNDVVVFPALKFKNKKQEDFYWRTVRDVRKTLPYAKMIQETLVETYEYLQTFPTKKEREQYLKEMEGSVFAQYKPILKKFTKGQANMLVKLIQRETNQSGYDILKAFLGSTRAIFWKGFGKLFGVNISKGFRPDKDEKDAIIERVATLIEQGQL